MITNNEIAKHIENLIPFRAFSVVGFFNKDGSYNVWSYQTAILEVRQDSKKKEIVFFNNLYYSPTTSNIQNIICDLLKLPRQRGKQIFSQADLK